MGGGEEALLVFAGSFPDGVEGGALFLPFLGGIVDIELGFEAVCDGVEVTSRIGRWWYKVKKRCCELDVFRGWSRLFPF